MKIICSNSCCVIIVIFGVLALAVGCGGSGSGGGGASPMVSSLKDAEGTAIEVTGFTTRNPNSFTLTFSEAMDITNLANITLACTPSGGTALNAVLIPAETSTPGVYALAVTDAWKYALLSCVMTIPKTVTSSGGTALAEDVTYTFTNPCALNDDFNAQSISDEASSCWRVSTELGTLMTWAQMSDIFSFDAPNSSLYADFTGKSPNEAAVYKVVSVGSSGFEIEVHFKSITGFTQIKEEEGEASSSEVLFAVIDSTDFMNPSNIYYVGIAGDGTVQRCIAVGIDAGASSEGEPPQIITYSASCNEDTGYYIKLAQSGGAVSLKYKREGDADYSDLQKADPAGPGFPILDFSGDNRTIILDFSPIEGCNGRVSLDSIRTSGILKSGQY